MKRQFSYVYMYYVSVMCEWKSRAQTLPVEKHNERSFQQNIDFLSTVFQTFADYLKPEIIFRLCEFF